MFNYAQIDLTTGKVVSVSELSGEVENEALIPIPEADSRLLRCYYTEGIFEGHYTKVTYANQRVTAEVLTYLDEAATNYNGDVAFEYEGQTITVQAVNGVASIDFTADPGLTCTVKTANEKFENGAVTFNV